MAPPVPGFKLNENGIPDFDDLPLRKGDPHLSAWGLYGDKDELGTLNRLTDERVAAAAKSEIRTGRRISLNWPLNSQQSGRSFFSRQAFHQELIRKDPRVVNDDVWSFNSQVATQWDGLRHYAYQREALFYNGVTQEDIHGPGSTVNGIHAWAEQGIVGRGILVDYHGWRTGAPSPPSASAAAFSPLAQTSIPLEDLLACLAAQGTAPRFGDILFVRTGFAAAYAALTPDELAAHRAVVPHRFGGVARSAALLRWLWSTFAAVAGDQPSFESWPSASAAAASSPSVDPDADPALAGHALHEILLAGWGCPVGELFDLEALAAHCRAERRWSFFVASDPCNLPGGVASPPNVLAIF